VAILKRYPKRSFLGHFHRENLRLIGARVDLKRRPGTEALPDLSLNQVIDSIRFLKTKNSPKKASKKDAHLLSEAVLAKDWLKPEEDEAWKNL
jgi:hypothetical protein